MTHEHHSTEHSEEHSDEHSEEHSTEQSERAPDVPDAPTPEAVRTPAFAPAFR
jgi:hypothetical protein